MLEDLKLVYKDAGRQTIETIKKVPLALLLPLFFSIIYYGLIRLIRPILFGFPGMQLLGGFILAFVEALILSFCYSILRDVIEYGRLTANSLNTGGATRYFWNIYSVFFIFMLLELLGGILGNLGVFIPILLTILLNPIPEVIYIRGEGYTGAFEYSFNFIKENWLHWLLPYILYIIVVSFISPVTVSLLNLGRGVVNIPLGLSFPGYINMQSLIFYFLVQMVAGIYIIFRGFLFKKLQGSSRRKRKYMEGWQ